MLTAELNVPAVNASCHIKVIPNAIAVKKPFLADFNLLTSVENALLYPRLASSSWLILPSSSWHHILFSLRKSFPVI